MGAHRLVLAFAACVCALAATIAVGAGSASASAPPYGGYSAAAFGGFGYEAGQFYGAFGVGADAVGDVYVSEQYNERVSKFDSSGKFLSAFGWGVLNGASELQTCTTECRSAGSGSAAGQFDLAHSLAVDGSGDVYVVDFGNYRVEKFGPNGEFLLMFGGEVDQTTKANVCTAASKDTCGAGVQGTGDGQFGEWTYDGNNLTIGPGGNVYVGDVGRVQVFEPSGVWRETISLAALSSTGKVSALAVDAAGDVFVKIGNQYEEGKVPGVREIEPGGIVRGVEFDAGSETVTKIALDGAGSLFAVDIAGGFHITKYDVTTGEQTEAFGFRTADAYSEAMAYSTATGKLYVSDFNTVWSYVQPQSGPLVEPGSDTATPEPRGDATLQATLNPEGAETAYHLEYVPEAQYASGGFAGASSAPGASIGSTGEFTDRLVSVHLTGLTAGETYHYRFVATNASGTTLGADRVLQETPAALVDGPWATNVANTSATLNVRIDPLGANTSYRLEYGTSTSYETVLTGSVGEGESSVLVSYHRQALQPATTYHYRIVTSNSFGTIAGADHVFTTQAAGGELQLPDGRAWELVSPADKHGALIEAQWKGPVQAAADGHAVTYVANEPITEHVTANTGNATVRSMHGGAGWISAEFDVSPKAPEGRVDSLIAASDLNEPLLLTPDLSMAVIEPPIREAPLLSPEATERTPYIRDDETRVYRPLVTPANVPVGVKFGGHGSSDLYWETQVHFAGATPDLSHAVLLSALALAPGAESKPCHEGHEESVCPPQNNLYEWGASGGPLKQVNIMPDGKPMQIPANASDHETSAYLGRANRDVAHAISNDGRWIVWSRGIYESMKLYVRDMVAGKTLQVGGTHHPLFQTMSGDGSRVLFIEGGELYELNTSTGATQDLTANHLAGEAGAGVQSGLLGTSEDLSYVYFVAKGILASNENANKDKAMSGAANLYLLREEGGRWSATYIATLSGGDRKDWSTGEDSGAVQLEEVTSRVSPNGQYVAFMSAKSLTGYDNIDANSPVGEPQADAEVYVYAAESGKLACVSCNPTGARPVGVLDEQQSFDRLGTWYSRWIAGNIPGWNHIEGNSEGVWEQPRYLSNSGRLFFNSSDALVSQDVNGTEDVYEYEPVGVGDCSSASRGFSVASEGCVSLLSAGTSAGESVFMAASENGNDAFLLTASKLVGEDYDASYDVYDAHVCSTGWACVPQPVVPPPCTSGDSCKPAPSPQPAIFGPAPSATFSGTGNVSESAKSALKHTRKKAHTKRRRRKKGRKHRAIKTGRSAAATASKRGGK